MPTLSSQSSSRLTCALVVLAGAWVSCFRHPAGKTLDMTCATDLECPSGYQCLVPGVKGGCHRIGESGAGGQLDSGGIIAAGSGGQVGDAASDAALGGFGGAALLGTGGKAGSTGGVVGSGGAVVRADGPAVGGVVAHGGVVGSGGAPGSGGTTSIALGGSGGGPGSASTGGAIAAGTGGQSAGGTGSPDAPVESCATTCGYGQHCSAGKCICDTTSCYAGCCAGDTCLLAQDITQCGSAGAACAPCPARKRCYGGVSGGTCVDCYATDSLCDNACTDLQSDLLHCGTCANKCTGVNPGCVGGRCYDEVQQVNIKGGSTHLAVDATHIYFSDSRAGTISRIPISGGPVEVLASAQNNPGAVVVDATNVYWSNQAAGSGAVMKVPLAGGTPTTLALDGDIPGDVTIDAANVYWSTPYSADGSLSGSIEKVAIAGGSAVAITSPTNGAVPLIIDGNNVYWPTSGNIMKTPLAGGDGVALLSSGYDPGSIGSIGGIGLAGGYIYFVNYAPATAFCSILRVSTAGGSPTTIASSASKIYCVSITVDQAGIYLAGINNNRSIVALSLDGTVSTTLFAYGGATSLTVFGNSIYWYNANAQTIEVTSKLP